MAYFKIMFIKKMNASKATLLENTTPEANETNQSIDIGLNLNKLLDLSNLK